MLVIANRWTDQLSVSTVPCLCPQQNHLVAIVTVRASNGLQVGAIGHLPKLSHHLVGAWLRYCNRHDHQVESTSLRGVMIL
jgi:hypothetical protein